MKPKITDAMRKTFKGKETPKEEAAEKKLVPGKAKYKAVEKVLEPGKPMFGKKGGMK